MVWVKQVRAVELVARHWKACDREKMHLGASESKFLDVVVASPATFCDVIFGQFLNGWPAPRREVRT